MSHGRRAGVCLVLLMAMSLISRPAQGEPPSPRQHVADELLVKLRAGASPTAAKELLDRLRVRETEPLRAVPQLYRLKLAAGGDLQRALSALRQSPHVVYAEPNFIVQRSQSVTPNDPYYMSQWALPPSGINAEGAWTYTTGSGQVVVAVLDTGIDDQHEDLVANLYRNNVECTGQYGDHDGNGYANDCSGVSILTGGPPVDDHGHGTHLAGIIGAAGNNALGVAGVNWTVKILPCKFLDVFGSGTVAGALACLDYVAAMKARGVNVVATNNSWVTSEYSQALYDAIKAQRERGIVFVTSAGNSAYDIDAAPLYPCSFDLTNILCVGASQQNGSRAGFSPWGRTTVHLNAPGQDIASTWPQNGYQFMSGTSLGAAHVSGVVALLAAQDPTRDWRALKNLVLAGAMSFVATGETVTNGRLSASASLGCNGQYAYGRLTPHRAEVTLPAGTPLTLSFLVALCGSSYATPLSARVESMNGPTELVDLLDDGARADQVAGDAVFTGTWTPPAVGGSFNVVFPDGDNVRVTVEGTAGTGPALRLKPGFPVKANSAPAGYAGGQGIHVLVGNIDGDPLPEILVPNVGTGELLAFKADGTPVPGWPVVGPQGVPYPALGQLVAGSPGLQVFAGHFSGGLVARSGSGGVLPGWPRQGANYIASPATLADIDGDGIDEIFIEEEDWKLHAYRADGTRVPGWPHAGFYGGQERHTSAVADLDGDGRLEIVTASGWTSNGVALLAHRSDGTLMPGFPVLFPGLVNTYPVIGDVDGDGSLEILVPARVGGADGVYIYSTTGALKRIIQASGTSSYGTAIALADLDGDGVPEIIMQTDSFVNVFKGDGTIAPGWPVPLPPFARVDNSSPVVGDVDGDGQPDVVILAPIAGALDGTGQLLVFNRHGALLPGFPYAIAGIGFGAVPAIADIDGDGRNDIIVAADYWSGTSGVFDKVWAFDFPDSPAPHGPILWGQFMGGPKHQGSFGPAPVVTTYALTVALTGTGTGQVTSSPAGIACPGDCSKRYVTGTAVTLTATPDAVSTFTGWTGACAGQGNACTVTLGADASTTATFAGGVTLTVIKSGGGSGTVTSSPTGIACGVDCTETYRAGTTVTLTPTATAGSTFTGWSGVCAGQPGACSFTLGSNTTVTADFAPPVELTVQAPGASGAVTSLPAGINCGTDCSEAYTLGTLVTLSFTPAPKYVLVEWTGACAGSTSSCAVTMTAPLTVGVSVARVFTLAVSRAGTGGGTITSSPVGIACGSDCAEDYRESTAVTLTATPASGSVFTGWSGACSGQASTCSVTMTSDQSVTATFAPLYTLTVARAGTAGTVASAPAGIACGTDCTETYVAGTSVTLTALPGSGSAFASWSGVCAGQANPCVLGLTTNTSVTATFGTARTLTVAVNGAGTVTSADGRIACPADCSEIYANGTVVTLTATPAAGGTFRGWSGACSGTASTCTVTMTAARSVTARFK